MSGRRIVTYFNMVEIALAMAVIAIGISSVMVLFPLGLNTSKAATADNNIPDAAEYLLSYLECTVVANWRDTAGAPRTNPLFEGGAAALIKDAKPAGVNPPYADANWPQVLPDGSIRRLSPGYNTYRFIKTITLADGSTVEDFSLMALAWREPMKFVAPNGGEMRASPDLGITLNVELSWPTDIDYDKREKRLYQLDLFNPYYVPTP